MAYGPSYGGIRAWFTYGIYKAFGMTATPEYELKYCPIHGTMTNHKDGKCAKTPDVPGDHDGQADAALAHKKGEPTS